MVLWVKVLVTKPGDPSLISKRHMVQGKNQYLQAVYAWNAHAMAGTHVEAGRQS